LAQLALGCQKDLTYQGRPNLGLGQQPCLVQEEQEAVLELLQFLQNLLGLVPF
jgi:hypothetical protein